MDSKYSEVRIIELEAMTVASASIISSNPEEEVMGFMNSWAEKQNINPQARRFGFDVPVSEEEQRNGLRGYEYWISLDKEISVDEGITIKHIEKHNYAVLRIKEPFENPFEYIPKGWEKLSEWVEKNGYSCSGHCDGYCLEEVVEANGIQYMDIYIPI